MTVTISDLQEMRSWRKKITDKTVGFVPTMGALHAGHAELLKKARAENDFVVLSIYVNPTQFNNSSDLEKYPKTLEADLEIAKANSVDVVWTPAYPQIYPDAYRYKISERELSKKFEGVFRPGHFDGMLTIVMKLLNVTTPTRAYFGEKDYQQMLLVKGMAEAFFLDSDIVAVPTLREESGLAMSSRNVRLSEIEKEKAPLIFKTLKSSKTAREAFQALESLGFKVEYVEDFQGRRLVAATLGNTRLIDNVKL